MTLITKNMHCVIFWRKCSKFFEWIARLKSFTKSNTPQSSLSEDMDYNCYFTKRVIQNYLNYILPAIKPLLVRKNSEDLRSNQNGKENFVFPTKPPFLHILQRKSSEMLSKYNTGLSSLGVPGVPWHPQVLADQLTLYQPRGADYAHQIKLVSRNFRPSDGPAIQVLTYSLRQRTGHITKGIYLFFKKQRKYCNKKVF